MYLDFVTSTAQLPQVICGEAAPINCNELPGIQSEGTALRFGQEMDLVLLNK